jgi:hypothetical protein
VVKPATPPSGTTDVATGAAAPEKKWDGVQRDTLVKGEIADINNMIYIVGETVADSDVVYFTNMADSTPTSTAK